MSYGLSFLFINAGRQPIHTEQIQVKGSKKIGAQSIVNASEIGFPKALIEINPKEVELNLLKNLPLNRVSIRRGLFPPNLEIELQEKKPIAFAKRRSSKGEEQGMLDKEGFWIPLKIANKIEPPVKPLYVDGWMASHRESISIILANREKLGSALEKITLTPNGEIILKTKAFKAIYLGRNILKLKEQLKTISQLSKSLPSSFLYTSKTSIDIRDPKKPELQLSKTFE